MKDNFNTVHIYGNKTLYSYCELNISALKKLAKKLVVCRSRFIRSHYHCHPAWTISRLTLRRNQEPWKCDHPESHPPNPCSPRHPLPHHHHLRQSRRPRSAATFISELQKRSQQTQSCKLPIILQQRPERTPLGWFKGALNWGMSVRSCRTIETNQNVSYLKEKSIPNDMK